MKRPSFQFYPDDWRNNAHLRRCSWAARGVWIELISLMHDSDQYGVLAWPLKEIAQALGCPLALLKELADKGVLKGCDNGKCEPFIYTPRSGRRDGTPVTLIVATPGPIWFSSRMVRDEHVRKNAGAATRFRTDGDTTPTAGSAPRRSPRRRQGEDQSDGSSSPSSSSSPSETQIPPSHPSGARSPHGSRLPDDWHPGPDERAFAANLGLDPDRISAQFRDFWHGKPGKDGRKLDWPATWRNWCRREAERRPRPASQPASKLGWMAAELGLAADRDDDRPTLDLRPEPVH